MVNDPINSKVDNNNKHYISAEYTYPSKQS